MSPPAVRAARLLHQESPLGRTLLGTTLLSGILFGLCMLALAYGTTSLVQIFLINVIAVVGLGVFTGNSGVLSFGHAGFMGLAAYISGLLSMDTVVRTSQLRLFPQSLSGLHVSFLAGILIAVTITGLVAAVFGVAVARLPRDPAAITTLGVLVIVNSVLIGSDRITGGSVPLYGVHLLISWKITLLIAIATVAIARLFRESRWGLQLRATREDELAASALGANIRPLRMISWSLSAMFAGLAGLLLGHFLGAFSPSQFYLTTTIGLVAMLIVGGASTVTGAVVGTALITAVNEVLSRIESGANFGLFKLPELFGLPTLGVAVALLATMFFRREGLVGRREIDVMLATALARGRPTHTDDDNDRPEAQATTEHVVAGDALHNG
jgi:branched-chain amino acid transport system ATP-binding protein/branched-chain amino acid transport system permease protein